MLRLPIQPQRSCSQLAALSRRRFRATADAPSRPEGNAGRACSRTRGLGRVHALDALRREGLGSRVVRMSTQRSLLARAILATTGIAVVSTLLFVGYVTWMRVRAERVVNAHVAQAKERGEPLQLDEIWGAPLDASRNALTVLQLNAARIEELDPEASENPAWLREPRRRALEAGASASVRDALNDDEVLSKALQSLDAEASATLAPEASRFVLEALDAELAPLIEACAPALEREGVWLGWDQLHSADGVSDWYLVREYGTLLAAHGRLRVHFGDFEGALRAARALVWLCDALDRQPCSAFVWLRLGCERDALEVLRAVLREARAPGAEWSAIEARVTSWDPWPWLHRCVLADRALVLDPRSSAPIVADRVELGWIERARISAERADALERCALALAWNGDGTARPLGAPPRPAADGSGLVVSSATRWIDAHVRRMQLAHGAWLVRSAGVDAARAYIERETSGAVRLRANGERFELSCDVPPDGTDTPASASIEIVWSVPK